MNNEMTIDQALAVVSQVCANHMGTLKDHQTIQLALQTVEKGLEHKDDRPVAVPETKSEKSK